MRQPKFYFSSGRFLYNVNTFCFVLCSNRCICYDLNNGSNKIKAVAGTVVKRLKIGYCHVENKLFWFTDYRSSKLLNSRLVIKLQYRLLCISSIICMGNGYLRNTTLDVKVNKEYSLVDLFWEHQWHWKTIHVFCGCLDFSTYAFLDVLLRCIHHCIIEC